MGTALTLPGLESPEVDRSRITYADHVDAIVEAITRERVPALFVVHSGSGYSGYTASDRDERIAAMVYVDTAHGIARFASDFEGREKALDWFEIEGEVTRGP